MEYTFDELIQSYEIFLSELVGYDKDVLRNYYGDVTKKMASDFQESNFIKILNRNLKLYNEEYILYNNFVLLDDRNKIEIKIKPYNSMIEKCFRKDVIEKKVLDVLEEGTYDELKKYAEHSPINCFWTFSDIIRTRLTVNYMDGALFMCDNIQRLAREMDLTPYKSYKAQDDGYYAIHLDVEKEFEIPDIIRKTIKINSKVEIQINTAIQNLLIDLSHEYYEQVRKRVRIQDIKWQWLHNCDEFIPNYLGHMAHYIEGMMLNVRDKVQL